ncbi:alpha-amylase family protein [soil metagenome]
MVQKIFTSPSHKITIYQLLVRLFGNKNNSNLAYGTLEQNGVGKFADIDNKALKSIKELGITHIWFTGVLEHSTLSGYPASGITADDPHIVKGRAGSPYAIRDYFDVSADLAKNPAKRMAEFNALLKRTHQLGMKAIIDFVPNHVARSYHSDCMPKHLKDFGEGDDTSVLFHPDNNFLYLQGEAFQAPADYVPLDGRSLPENYLHFTEFPARVTGNDVYSAHPSSNDWFETIKLNFGVDPNPPHQTHFDPIPRTWQKLLEILLYWCEKKVDGFRCDMAEMVPAEFWEWVIPCVKTKYPDVIFIGEIYKPELYERYLDRGYFDYLYDKVGLYDTLASLLRGTGNADDLTNCVRNVEEYSERMLSFLENHDEERMAWKGFAGNALLAIPAMTVAATISKGPVMIYNGQEVGETGDGNLGFAGERGRTTIFDYAGMPELQQWMNGGKFNGAKLSKEQIQVRSFYSNLLNICLKIDAIQYGSIYDLQYINRYGQSEGFDERFVFAFIRHTAISRVLIVANFSKTDNFHAWIKIPQDAWNHMGISIQQDYTFTDLLDSGYVKKYNGTSLSAMKLKKSGLEINLQAASAYILQFA